MRVTLVSAAVVIALMVVQAASGMIVPSVYRDEGFALDAWRVNDPVTLFVAAPLAVVASGLALIAGLVALDFAALGRGVGPRMPARPLAAYLTLWAATLGVAWVGQAVGFAVTGVGPALGADAFRLIAALDLSLVVTPVAIGAAWLWARGPWGVVISIVLLTSLRAVDASVTISERGAGAR